MNAGRRAWLRAALGAAQGSLGVCLHAHAAAEGPAAPDAVRRGRAFEFPRDHGAHESARIEWWYITGWLADAGTGSRSSASAGGGANAGGGAAPAALRLGFQVTFFRSATGLAADSRSRFAARHVLFAHAAITDLAARRHWHSQRTARHPGAGRASFGTQAETGDTQLALGGAGGAGGPGAGGLQGAWRLAREAGAPDRWRTALRTERFALDATFTATQPVLLQGDAGFSRKGPGERQASHYYSAPQLEASAQVQLGAAAPLALQGRAWLDHEWSDELMPEGAVGWDWIGINLLDGSALTAFRLRRADGSPVWAGGSWRADGEARARAFAAEEVHWQAERRWSSATTKAVYPVVWQLRTPAGRHTVRALLDAQELDSRTGTGAIYWEGLAELLDDRGARVGLGYLEMTGYAAALKLG